LRLRSTRAGITEQAIEYEIAMSAAAIRIARMRRVNSVSASQTGNDVVEGTADGGDQSLEDAGDAAHGDRGRTS
jgi:hypothetical protein